MKLSILIFTVILSSYFLNISRAQKPATQPPYSDDSRHLDGDRPIRQLTDGDNPLSTTYTWGGYGDAAVVGAAFDGIPEISGVFDLTGIPEESEIIKAFFAITGWQPSNTNAYGYFNGNNLGSMQPVAFDQDHTYYLSLYRWDVTTMVTGNDLYSFSGSNLSFGYLAYLVVVYQNPALPAVTITINDGAESLQSSSSTTSFNDILPGNGTIKILTQAGDDSDSEGESIIFNEIMLAGPDDVFNSNIGDHADYHEFNLTNIQGENSLTITTGEDWFGIHLALLISEGFQSDIDESAGLPLENSLFDNYPNPFNASTLISYTLQEPTDVRIEIFDILGRHVDTLIDEKQPAGYHRIIWNADDCPSGVYFARLEAGSRSQSVRLVLLR